MQRIARYSGLKNRSSHMAKHLKALSSENPDREDISKLAKTVTGCANYLVFHDYYTVDQLRLVKARTCKKSLLCPFCAARRAAKQVDKYLPKLQAAIDSEPALKPVMITLTVKNGESLSERYLHLKSAYRALQKRRSHTIEGRGWTEFAKVKGSIHSYEFTRTQKGWHPHIHMVALVSDWVDQKALSDEWKELTGDSFVVDIRKISDQGDGLASGMLEVFKYALKFQDLDLDDTWHAYETLKGKRLMGSFGCLRGLSEPDNLLDDPLENLPYLELLYTFQKRSGAYDLKTTKRVEATSPDEYDTPSRHETAIPDDLSHLPGRTKGQKQTGERIGARAPFRRRIAAT